MKSLSVMVQYFKTDWNSWVIVSLTALHQVWISNLKKIHIFKVKHINFEISFSLFLKLSSFTAKNLLCTYLGAVNGDE